jgi:hypothetical protein
MPLMLSRIPLKILLLAVMGLSAAAVVAGLELDVKAFGEHLLAELVGLLASVVAAVFVVDVLVERERAQRWELVSVQTRASLRFAIVRAGLDVYLLLPPPRPGAADPFTMAEVGEGGLAKALSTLAVTIEHADGIDLAAALNALRPHLAAVREAIMPRLLAIGQHELIARVATLEGALQRLEYTAWLEQRFRSLPDPRPELAQVLVGLAQVSELTEDAATR